MYFGKNVRNYKLGKVTKLHRSMFIRLKVMVKKLQGGHNVPPRLDKVKGGEIGCGVGGENQKFFRGSREIFCGW